MATRENANSSSEKTPAAIVAEILDFPTYKAASLRLFDDDGHIENSSSWHARYMDGMIPEKWVGKIDGHLSACRRCKNHWDALMAQEVDPLIHEAPFGSFADEGDDSGASTNVSALFEQAIDEAALPPGKKNPNLPQKDYNFGKCLRDIIHTFKEGIDAENETPMDNIANSVVRYETLLGALSTLKKNAPVKSLSAPQKAVIKAAPQLIELLATDLDMVREAKQRNGGNMMLKPEDAIDHGKDFREHLIPLCQELAQAIDREQGKSGPVAGR